MGLRPLLCQAVGGQHFHLAGVYIERGVIYLLVAFLAILLTLNRSSIVFDALPSDDNLSTEVYFLRYLTVSCLLTGAIDFIMTICAALRKLQGPIMIQLIGLMVELAVQPNLIGKTRYSPVIFKMTVEGCKMVFLLLYVFSLGVMQEFWMSFEHQTFNFKQMLRQLKFQCLAASVLVIKLVALGYILTSTVSNGLSQSLILLACISLLFALYYMLTSLVGFAGGEGIPYKVREYLKFAWKFGFTALALSLSILYLGWIQLGPLITLLADADLQALDPRIICAGGVILLVSYSLLSASIIALEKTCWQIGVLFSNGMALVAIVGGYTQYQVTTLCIIGLGVNAAIMLLACTCMNSGNDVFKVFNRVQSEQEDNSKTGDFECYYQFEEGHSHFIDSLKKEKRA